MSAVVKDVPAARLVIAARHDDKAFELELADLVTEFHLEASVEFHFNTSEEEKRELLQSASVLVVSSSVEGFGIVVLEANACGVPVVASSGVPVEVVRDRGNGLRYEFGDIGALSQRIVELLTDKDLHTQLANSGLVFARGFGWRTVAPQYENVLQAVVATGTNRT
jgi:glycosyltransferase involved in cell wall biosynthesis